MFQRRFLLVLAVAAVAISPMLANATGKTAQQKLMSECSAQNKGKTGDSYKSAQKDCLDGRTRSTSKTGAGSQKRTTDCNAKASGKKGDERKRYLSSCLKRQ